MSQRWMVTGASGMLGRDLCELLERRGAAVIALPKERLDITNRTAVLEAASDARPDVIVNCAAFTKVDDCETQEELATAVNGTAVRHLADAANKAGARLVQISTDFVFDGSSTIPWDVKDPVYPLSAYGRSKLVGEKEARRARKHLILRTSWVFGPHGPNFVEAIRRQIVDLGKSELKVVHDQKGRPTYTRHLAAAILPLVDRRHDGIAHYADEPECTWFEFAQEIARRVAGEREVVVHPVTTAEFPRPARRPSYSVLSTWSYEWATGLKPASWKDGLTDYFERRPPVG